MKHRQLALALIITAVTWLSVSYPAGATVLCGKRPASMVLVWNCGFECDNECYWLKATLDLEGIIPATYYCVDASATEGCSDQGTYDEVFEWRNDGVCGGFPPPCTCGSFGGYYGYAYHSPATRRVDASCAGSA